MAVSIKMKPKAIILKGLNLEQGGKVHAFFTATCARHMDKYVPYDEGTLATTVIDESGNPTENVTATTITYTQPYATYQYEGQRQDGTHKINEANRNRSMHPEATSHWDRVMMSIERKKVIKEVQDYFDKKVKE
jgi:hypothetical protein